MRAAMQKTVVVRVERWLQHVRYGRRLRHWVSFKAHSEDGQVALGDRVEITQCRPLSRQKRWRVTRVLARALAQPGAPAATGSGELRP